MKNILLILMLLVPFVVAGQVPDTLTAGKTVDSLLHVSEEFYKKGAYQSAYDAAALAGDQAKAAFGDESYRYGVTVRGMANALAQTPKVAEAEALFLKVRDIYAKTIGTDQFNYASCLNELGLYYTNTGQYAKAESALLEAKAISEKVIGKRSYQYSMIVNNIALLYVYRGEYERAIPYTEEAKGIIESIAGKKHQGYYAAISVLGYIYDRLGRYETGLTYLLEARELTGIVKGVKHPDYALATNNLAIVYQGMGNYEKAEKMFLEALQLRETLYGKEHQEYATSLGSLASLYIELGQYDQSEQLYLESLRIREKIAGKESEDYALVLNNLAALYYNAGRYTKALPISLESKAINLKKLGPNHPKYATNMSLTGLIYLGLMQYDSAEYYLREAVRMREKTSGKEHPDYAKAIGNLASMFDLSHRPDSALALHLESYAIREKKLGPTSDEYSKSVENLALFYIRNHNSDLAYKYYLMLNALGKSRIRQNAAYLTEKELQKNLLLFETRKDNFFSLNYLNWPDSIIQESFDNALFFKGFLLNGAQSVNSSVASAPDSVQLLHERLRGFQRLLSKQYARPIADRKNVADLETKVNTLEKELIRALPGYGEALRQVGWQDVRNKLQPDEAVVEFVHFRYYNKIAYHTDSILYAALVLLPGDRSPHFVHLCEQRQLEALIANPTQKDPKRYLQDVYWPKAAGQPSLYSLLWAPIEPLLKSTKTVYFSPSGLLHRLHFGAISPDKRSTLADSRRFVLLGSSRQLAITPPAVAYSTTAAIFGGVRYEMDSTAVVRANAGIPSDSTADKGSGLFHFAWRDEPSRSSEEDEWAYLPETATEADNVNNILQRAGMRAVVRKGYAATEEAFKEMGKTGPSPRIVHVATHGFFFPDPKDTLSGKNTGPNNDPVFKISEHPMIRSGLMLAGSDYAWKTGQPLTGLEDGILTAYEISQMNLSGTELVVLSACETGLGDIQGNEGVYGLQRAFKIAGAKNILMSLWKVPDTATRELMTVFYQKWLEEKLSVRDALIAAQQHLRAQTKYSSPYYWGGFVLVE